jgi:protein-tyrosine phosphatase
MGNICRSPMAEAVFSDMVTKEGLSDQFFIDSVGTDAYHVGDLAHRGTRRVLAKHSIQCHSISRRVARTDLDEADYIIAMDHHNASDLQYMARGIPLDGRLHLLLDFAGNTRVRDVPDPYYTGGFEEVFRLVEAGCRGLLAHIRQEKGI